MGETQLSAAIRASLERAGCLVERIQSGVLKVRGGRSHGASPGTPDLLVIKPQGPCKDAILGFVEVKVPGAQLRPAQKEYHARLRQINVRVAVVSSPAAALAEVMTWR